MYLIKFIIAALQMFTRLLKGAVIYTIMFALVKIHHIPISNDLIDEMRTIDVHIRCSECLILAHQLYLHQLTRLT